MYLLYVTDHISALHDCVCHTVQNERWMKERIEETKNCFFCPHESLSHCLTCILCLPLSLPSLLIPFSPFHFSLSCPTWTLSTLFHPLLSNFSLSIWQSVPAGDHATLWAFVPDKQRNPLRFKCCQKGGEGFKGDTHFTSSSSFSEAQDRHKLYSRCYRMLMNSLIIVWYFFTHCIDFVCYFLICSLFFSSKANWSCMSTPDCTGELN